MTAKGLTISASSSGESSRSSSDCNAAEVSFRGVILRMLDGVEFDGRKSPGQLLAILLRIEVENENLGHA